MIHNWRETIGKMVLGAVLLLLVQKGQVTFQVYVQGERQAAVEQQRVVSAPAEKKRKIVAASEADAEQQELARAASILLGKSLHLQHLMDRYKTQHGKVPEYVSDLDCVPQNCPAGQVEGSFFITEGGHWLRLEPKSNGNALYFSCDMSIKTAPLGIKGDCPNYSNRGVPDFSFSPSFDCAKAERPMEKLICRDDRLSELDNNMHRAYRQLYDTSKPENQPALKAQQVAFITRVNGDCKDALCVRHLYEARLEELEKVAHDARYGVID